MTHPSLFRDCTALVLHQGGPELVMALQCSVCHCSQPIDHGFPSDSLALLLESYRQAHVRCAFYSWMDRERAEDLDPDPEA